MDAEEGSEGVGRVLLGSSHCTRRVVPLALHRNLAQWRAGGRLTPKCETARGGTVVGAYGLVGGGEVGRFSFYRLHMRQR